MAQNSQEFSNAIANLVINAFGDSVTTHIGNAQTEFTKANLSGVQANLDKIAAPQA